MAVEIDDRTPEEKRDAHRVRREWRARFAPLLAEAAADIGNEDALRNLLWVVATFARDTAGETPDDYAQRMSTQALLYRKLCEGRAP